MTKTNNIEIMAPVGSWESLAAALEAGADSVYFGIEKLNMRAKSSVNFSTEDMHTIVRRCREKGVNTYLTVNTVIYPEDIPLMHEIVDEAKKAGVTAIIASDVAVMQYACSQDVEVHLSTQLNIANTEALRFYAQFADVVVLARELNMTQVAEIYRDIVEQDIRGRHGELIRIEMFCHGALCMAVSGKCYLSLHNYNTSANRGACVQICRRRYRLSDKETDVELEVDNEYLLSPKDLKTIHFLNKMLDAGVRVLKIEGRARGAEYVKTVVGCYREAVQAYEAGEFNDNADVNHIAAKIAGWDERLQRVFNRGWWNGYYLGQRLGEWTHTYGSRATRRKVYCGKVTNFFKQISVAEILVEACEAHRGDEFLVTGETTGAYEDVLEEIRVDLKPAEVAGKGVYFSLKTDRLLHRGDKFFILEKTE